MLAESVTTWMVVKVPVNGQVKKPTNKKQKVKEIAKRPEKLHPLFLHIKLYV